MNYKWGGEISKKECQLILYYCHFNQKGAKSIFLAPSFIYYIVIVQQLFVFSLYYLTRTITFQLFLYFFHFFLRCCQANNYIPWSRRHSHTFCLKIDLY